VDADGARVHLEPLGAVLELVVDAVHVVGKLAFLARGNEPGAQPVGDGSRHDESARFDAEHTSDPPPDEAVDDRVDDRREPNAVAEQRGDVLEDNARRGKVGNVPGERAEIGQDGCAAAARLANSSGYTSSTCVAIHP